ncbi:ABC transporter ATP-binding protein [Jeotgalibacillus soli]|uniref:ABC transporter ATP-binding protein n=1 Tax=Jeotgalibacillus soli TaxID=889306 RepID=A0A0C2VT63_9BACL|nr:ABC transporter ATP-binding protein [Jeotgalibacillus soli]KIL47198.1 ABC transporter ATP-binding protein [Jeotgalibacillus soli]
MSRSVLQLREVSFHYEGERDEEKLSIFHTLNLSINNGEFISIVGPSGSGKSTLFRLITGLEQPAGGDILLNGEIRKDRLGSVGYMPQQDLLMPWRSILDNAALPLELKGIKKAMAHKQVMELLEEFGLKGSEYRYPSELSGGMKQRVSFMRTVLSGSNLMILDEPFSALDAITRMAMQEWLLEQWEKRKKTILFITHDVNEALFLSDRVFVFSEIPVRTLQEVKVPLERPRNLRDLNNPDVIKLKDHLIDQLRVKVKP